MSNLYLHRVTAWTSAEHNQSLLIIGGIIVIVVILATYAILKARKRRRHTSLKECRNLRTRRTPSIGSLKVQTDSTNAHGDEFWHGIEGNVTFKGMNLGGLLYAGKGLKAVVTDEIDPALIDFSLKIPWNISDCSVRRLNYWPSFSSASPEARMAYLTWLSNGRKDPTADIGYVFLYFYGLERRALHDTKESVRAVSELTSIEREIERLLSIYAHNDSFRRYAVSLLDFLRSRNLPDKLYNTVPPPLRPARNLTFLHRVALAQCAADGRFLSAEWAYVWLISDSTTRLRMPAVRCPEEFRTLFIKRYNEAFSRGIRLPQNQTRLILEHHPASATFGSSPNSCAINLDLPDVSVLCAPVKPLQELAESCYAKLDGYSRALAKNTSRPHTFDVLLELPFALWPEQYRSRIEKLRNQIIAAGRPIVTSFEKLCSMLPEWHTITKPKLQSLYNLLAEAGLGMEPDIRFGGTVPELSSTIVLFCDDEADTPAAANPKYLAAALTLQLATAVAAADGEVSEVEEGLLLSQLKKWLYLSNQERRRLHANLELLLEHPPELTKLKKRIGTLNVSARQAIGDFIVEIAQADTEVTPAEIRSVERIFKLLGLEPKAVYEKAQITATKPVTVSLPTKVGGDFAIPIQHTNDSRTSSKLDPEKINALQKDSERVSAILAPIFNQEPYEPEPIPEPEPVMESQEFTVLGLDREHSALVRVLLSHSHWTRLELEELAADRRLMLDGALERVNDASFQMYEKPFFEGEDPIEVNQQVAAEVLL